MTKNTIILSLALLLGCALSAQAQNDPEDNEITVTDNDGNSEQIELPEALTHDLDSLMNLYPYKLPVEVEVVCETFTRLESRVVEGTLGRCCCGHDGEQQQGQQ